jgi:hypothetical protein
VVKNMTSNDIMQKMADAIAEHAHVGPLTQALAAIGAMHEPSEEQIAAAIRWTHSCGVIISDSEILALWLTMLRALLEPEDGSDE